MARSKGQIWDCSKQLALFDMDVLESGYKIYDDQICAPGIINPVSKQIYYLDSIKEYFKEHKPEFGNDFHIRLLKLRSILSDYVEERDSK